jgi:hypothetical protein
VLAAISDGPGSSTAHPRLHATTSAPTRPTRQQSTNPAPPKIRSSTGSPEPRFMKTVGPKHLTTLKPARRAGWSHNWQPGGPMKLAEDRSGWSRAHGRRHYAGPLSSKSRYDLDLPRGSDPAAVADAVRGPGHRLRMTPTIAVVIRAATACTDGIASPPSFGCSGGRRMIARASAA